MADESPKPGRSWIEISQVVAMPLVTLVVGYLLNSSLSSSQTRESNVRLYADMMGRREEADSSLRKDMFTSILQTFLRRPAQGGLPDPETDVLNLEMLAYNFHESLDLGPLFKHVERELSSSTPLPGGEAARSELRLRLERVAEEVKERQLAAIADSGTVDRSDLDVARMGGSDAWLNFKTVVPLKPGERRGGATLCLSSAETELAPTADPAAEPGRRYRQFRIELLDFAMDRREVEVGLAVSRPMARADCERLQDPSMEHGNIEAEAQFWVGPFGFPMIDNTRLSHSERCSVSVVRIAEDRITVAVAYFPASRASLKDKPYYDEVLRDLLRRQTGG